MSYDEYADQGAYEEAMAAYANEVEAQLEDEYKREAEAAQERAYQEYADTLCVGCQHPRHWHTDGGIEHRLRTGMPCIAEDPDATDEERGVECLCLGWWEPGTDCPYERECDRCGSKDGVLRHDHCSACGPVPLCRECAQLHADEIAEERAYEDRLANMTEEERAVWLQRLKSGDPTAPPDEPYLGPSKGLFQMRRDIEKSFGVPPADFDEKAAAFDKLMGGPGMAPEDDEPGPLEVVLDPDVPIGGGVIYSEEVFEKFSTLGKGSYQLGKEMTEEAFGGPVEPGPSDPSLDGKVVQFPPTPISPNLRCSCGSEWWIASVVIENGRVTGYAPDDRRCRSCGEPPEER